MASKISMELEAKGLNKIYSLIKAYPIESRRLLAQIGYETKKTLITQHLSGQDLRLTRLRDRRGRRTVSYSFDLKNSGVRVSSYPLNLFERGRLLRSGEREPGKKVITGRLPGKALAIVNRRAKAVFDKLAKETEGA